MAVDEPSNEDRFSLPTRLGRYRILTPLGSGGMAMVLLARAEGIGGFERDVAVKVLHPHLMGDESLVSQFLEEARIAARIRHPNVVPVLDVGRHAQGVHLVMEYVQGDSLHGLVHRAARQGNALSERIWMRVLTDALLGLHAAHELTDEQGEPLGVVHRDFTPHNILVGTDGLARLCDFGVVKVVSSDDKTATGIVKGKLRYLAPEQVRGRPLDRRCDVWAAGVTTWQLLTGKPLHDQRDQVDVLLRIAVEPPPPVRSLRPELPATLDEAVGWALTIDRDGRCPTALALRERLLEGFKQRDELASKDDVAAAVQQLCAARLAELGGKIERFKQLRDEMGALVQPLESDPTPSGEAARRALPAQPNEASETRTVPEIVGEPPDRASDPGVADQPPTKPEPGRAAPTVVDGGRGAAGAAASEEATVTTPMHTHPDEQTGAAEEATSSTVTTPMRSESGLVPGAADDDPPESVTRPIRSDLEPSPAPHQEAVATSAAGPAALPQPSTRSEARPLVMWAGAVLLPAALALGVWQLSGSPPLTAAQATFEATLTEVRIAAPSASTSAAGTSVRLTLVANAPIAELRVDGAVVPLAQPTKHIDVPLGQPTGTKVTVAAKSADGRKLEQECLVQAGSVRLNFPSPPSKGPRKIAPPSPYE